MTQEQYNRYIPYPNLRAEAWEIFQAGQRGGMTKDEFSGVAVDLSAAINEYVIDNKSYLVYLKSLKMMID